MKSILSILTSFLILFSAMGASNNFSFRVITTGNNLYPCNAGLRRISSTETVEPPNSLGDLSGDEIHYQFAEYEPRKFMRNDLNDNSSYFTRPPSSKRSKNDEKWVVANNETGDDRTYSSDTTKHRVKNANGIDRLIVLKNLKYYLQSDFSGSEYFVDICHYNGAGGTIVATPNDPNTDGLEKENNTMYFRSEVTLPNNADYIKDSYLSFKYELWCNGEKLLESEWIHATGKTSFENKEFKISKDNDIVRNKCVTRYKFRENNIDKKRNDRNINIEISTFTEIKSINENKYNTEFKL